MTAAYSLCKSEVKKDSMPEAVPGAGQMQYIRESMHALLDVQMPKIRPLRACPPMTTMLGRSSQRLGSVLSLAALSPNSVAALCSLLTSWTTLSISALHRSQLI